MYIHDESDLSQASAFDKHVIAKALKQALLGSEEVRLAIKKFGSRINHRHKIEAKIWDDDHVEPGALAPWSEENKTPAPTHQQLLQ